jgi:hypothetical protein
MDLWPWLFGVFDRDSWTAIWSIARGEEVMRATSALGLLTCNVRRVLVSACIVFLAIGSSVAAPLEIEYSAFIFAASATSHADIYFRDDYQYGGGVVPRGEAEFRVRHEKVSVRELRLTVLNKARLTNERPDDDAIGIVWKGTTYPLAAADDLVLPLMKFIDRGAFIAFTMPFAAFNQEYFRDNQLLYDRQSEGYVAKEFVPYANFLCAIDATRGIRDLPARLRDNILQNTNRTGVNGWVRRGSYVNADFHVRYQVFLETAEKGHVANVGGLPLRYRWNIGQGGAVIHDVQVFAFPDRKKIRNLKAYEHQYSAVLFFQTAAILRQFHEENPDEFTRFSNEVSQALAKR